MEFFGLTSFGASDPIKFLMRPDYKEPVSPPRIVEKLQKGDYTKPLVDLVRDVDMYSGILDGYSYRSYNRLNIGRIKGFHKEIGPKDVYRDSITVSMDYGWFLNDPELKDKNWYKQDVLHPRPNSDTTIFLNKVLRVEKSFKL